MSRTFDSRPDTRLKISDPVVFTRQFGSDWNSIAIGSRFVMTASAGDISNRTLPWNFLVGISDSSGGSPADARVSNHFLGVRGLYAGSAVHNGLSGQYTPVSTVVSGCHVVDGAYSGERRSTIATAGTHAAFGTAASSFSLALILYIAKGVTWTVQTVYFASSSASFPSHTESSRLLSAMMKSTLNLAGTELTFGVGAGNYTVSAARTFTVDESSQGTLDSVCFAWDWDQQPIELSDIFVHKIT
jgi:hypothetical protein